jgi:hypothetical protein
MVEPDEGVGRMGGSWKSRDFDAQGWRPPLPPVEARVVTLPGRVVSEAAVVAAYVMSVVAGMVMLLAAMKQGW